MAPTLEYLSARDFLPHLSGRIALLKSDFNVTVSKDGKTIEDRFRITQAAPFIRKAIEAGVIPVIATHLGRPKSFDPANPDWYNPIDSLDVIVEPLSAAIGREVVIIRINPATGNYFPDQLNREHIKNLAYDGKVSMLDNIRLHRDEQENGRGLARTLADVVDVSFQNGFGAAHRIEATSNHIHQFVPGFAGDLFVEEIEGHRAIKRPSSSYVVVVGGDKVQESLDIMRGLLRAETTTHRSNIPNFSLNLRVGEHLVDYILVGGHLMHAFVHTQIKMLTDSNLEVLPPELRKEYRGLRGINLGGHKPKESEISTASGLLWYYNNHQYRDMAVGKPIANGNRRIIIPVDYKVLRRGAAIDSVPMSELLDGDNIVDIGIKTRELYYKIISGATTIVWNGPMGVDDNEYAAGTRAIIDAIHSNEEAVKSIGGGSTMSITNAYEAELRGSNPGAILNVGHRSTGGGATLNEIALESPVAFSLIKSRTALLEGVYGPDFEYLRIPAIRMMHQR